jgi:alpha-N-acetylglucosamine transferase
MKITSIVDNDDGTEYNAVCLNDGDLMNLSNEDKVFTYPYSELIIKR